jgi:hypothetical protein
MSGIITAERFRSIAEGSAVGPTSAAASAIAFFRGSPYVGTSSAGHTASADPPQILRYAADEESWEVVYEPPMVEPTPRWQAPDLQVVGRLDGADRNAPTERRGDVPRDTGYRSMCVFQGKADAEPALYVSSTSRLGGVLLRSPDGRQFEQVGAAGLGDPDLYSIGSLVSFGGRLFAAPAGSITDTYLDPNLPPDPIIYVSDDPAAGVWSAACEPGFGDASNIAVASLCAAHGRLYAGTLNADRGFQLWQTTAEGSPPFQWTRVVVDGAQVFNQNLTVSAMAEFGGALYVGSGITGYGSDIVLEIGPAPAELIRVHPDGSWDLIAGRMRFSRDGMKVPLSLLGPGLDDFYNSAIWALAEHEGVLYLGTHQWEALRALELNEGPLVGGYQLWASENGEDWTLVIEDGHGNPAEFGIAAMASTPLGLMVGSRNESALLKLIGGESESALELKPGFEVLLGK